MQRIRKFVLRSEGSLAYPPLASLLASLLPAASRQLAGSPRPKRGLASRKEERQVTRGSRKVIDNISRDKVRKVGPGSDTFDLVSVFVSLVAVAERKQTLGPPSASSQ